MLVVIVRRRAADGRRRSRVALLDHCDARAACRSRRFVISITSTTEPKGVEWRQQVSLPAVPPSAIALVSDSTVCANALTALNQVAQYHSGPATQLNLISVGAMYVASNPHFPAGEWTQQFVFDSTFTYKFSFFEVAGRALDNTSRPTAAITAHWRDDSVVIDSLSQLVPMDSLFRLRRAMLTATSPVDYVPLIMCAREDLLWRYGTRPFEAAQKRLNDTVWKHSEEADVKAMWERVPKSGAITIENEKCSSLRRSDHAPDSVDGVSLEIEPIRPVPPKRP